MFKLVVLSALLALAVAKPSLHGAYLAPALHSAYIAPAAVSHQSRVDIHRNHAVLAPLAYGHHAALAHAPLAVAHHAPLALAHHTPAVVLGAHGVPLETADVVAAKALHFQAHALANHHYLHKRSLLASPLAYTTIAVGPSAVSHQSRVDVHSSPLVHAYAAPVVSHYAAAPLLSHYAAPYHGVLGHRTYGVHAW
ncbi:uncharacterized protein LOC143914340 [Arctopsyche grandis]|uniref:uncharacterized protein LOC143914340 n=1 Tax=Arctopsyche grandis TaxID=121162 RepID=UPI00406D6A42